MRFFLDNDVNSAVRTALIRAGHQVWTASQAGFADAEKDVLVELYLDAEPKIHLGTKRRRRTN